MRKIFYASVLILTALSCTKEQPENNAQGQEVSASEIEALRKELDELKSTVALLTPGTQEPGVSAEVFEALKKENEELKEQVELLTSTFFEVDGLRFDKNGSIISTPLYGSESVQDLGSNRTLTTQRTLDEKGRLIETMSRYAGYNSINTPPFYWRKVMYEYNGKTCKTTTQTSKFGLAAGVPYEEEIKETTYW